MESRTHQIAYDFDKKKLILSYGNISDTYEGGKILGEGAYGRVFTTTPESNYVVKFFDFNKITYTDTASINDIQSLIDYDIAMAKNEAIYNACIDGVGAFFKSEHPIKIERENENAKYKITSFPAIYVLAKKHSGVCAYDFQIKSLNHYLEFCKSTAESLEKIHAKNIVHEDIHEFNLLIEESKESDKPLVAHFIDFGLTGEEGSSLGVSTLRMHLDDKEKKPKKTYFKPPEFKGQQTVNRSKKHDIYCLGRLFREKLQGIQFSSEIESAIKELISEMMNSDPSKRPTISQVLEKIESIIVIYKFDNGKLNDATSFVSTLKLLNNPMNLLNYVESKHPGYITKIPHLKIDDLIALFKEDKDKQQCWILIFKSKRNSISTFEIIDRHLYCDRFIVELNEWQDSILQRSFVGYNKLNESKWEGNGATRYLNNVIKTSNSLETSLKKLPNNYQLHILNNISKDDYKKFFNENYLQFCQIAIATHNPSQNANEEQENITLLAKCLFGNKYNKDLYSSDLQSKFTELQKSMTDSDPSKRPTIDNVSKQFNQIVTDEVSRLQTECKKMEDNVNKWYQYQKQIKLLDQTFSDEIKSSDDAEFFKKHIVANDGNKLLTQLTTNSTPLFGLMILKHLESTENGHLAKLSNLNTKEFISLFNDSKDKQKEFWILLFTSKRNSIDIQLSSNEIMDQQLYCDIL